MIAIGPNSQPKTSFVAVIGGGEPLVDPAPDFLFNYRLDGTDANITRVGGNDFVGAPECPDATGQNYNGGSQFETANPDSALVAIGTGGFSFTGWFNTPDTGAIRDIISNGEGGVGDFRLRISATGAVEYRTDLVARSFGADFDDGIDHHFALTAKAPFGELICYVDGSPIGTLGSTNYNMIDTTLLSVGTRADNEGSKFVGMLDGIRFYDRDLTPEEVTDLSNYRCD